MGHVRLFKNFKKVIYKLLHVPVPTLFQNDNLYMSLRREFHTANHHHVSILNHDCGCGVQPVAGAMRGEITQATVTRMTALNYSLPVFAVRMVTELGMACHAPMS